MTSLTGKVIYQFYGDLLTTTNGGQGLSLTLEPVQDGLGQMSPMQIALNAVNFDRTLGNTFQLDGLALTASAFDINLVAQGDPIFPGTGGALLPSGTTAQRYSPPVNGIIRYNTTINAFEGFVNGSWQSFTAGAVIGPNSSIAGDIPIFADTSGKLLSDSGVHISDVTPPLLGPPPPGPLVTDVQLSGIDILSFNDVGLIFTGTGNTEAVYVCGFFPNTILGKSPNTVFGFANPSSPDAIVELTQGAFLLSRLNQTTINSLIDVDGMVVYNETANAFNFRQNGSWVTLSTGSVTSVLGTTNEITVTGSSTVTIAIANNPLLPGSAAVTLPSGSTAQRPGSPAVAEFRYNTDSNEFEGYNGSWISFGTGSGSVTSITAGSNLTGGTITTTGTIALSNTPTGLTSIGVGTLEFIGNQIISTNTNGNIDLLPNGTGSILLGAAPVTISPGGIISAYGIDVIAVGGNPGTINFNDGNNANFVALRSSTSMGANVTFELPATDGTSGQGLITNGSGQWSFTTLANRDAKFIIQQPDSSLPFAQDLQSIAGGVGGILKINTLGVVALAVPDTDYATEATLLAIEANCSAFASSASSSATTAAVSAGAAAASAVAAAASAVTAASEAGSITGATSAKFIIQEPNSNLPNAQSLSTLSGGIIKNTIVGPDGVLAIASPGSDYYSPGNPTTLRENFGNLFVGNNSGNNTLSGGSNTAMGFFTMPSASSASENTAFGAGTLENIIDGIANTCIGYNAGGLLTSSSLNVLIGPLAGKSITNNANSNVGIGVHSINTLVNGDDNVAVGDGSGNGQINLDGCTFIGAFATASVDGLINSTAIGTNAQVAVSSAIVLGSGSENVGIGTSSPTRLLTVLGGQISNLTETSSHSYTVLDTDNYVGMTSTSAAVSVVLPTPSSDNKGQIYTVKDESGGAATHNITVTVSGGSNIDGSSSAIISSNYGSISFYCNGTQWYVW